MTSYPWFDPGAFFVGTDDEDEDNLIVIGEVGPSLGSPELPPGPTGRRYHPI